MAETYAWRQVHGFPLDGSDGDEPLSARIVDSMAMTSSPYVMSSPMHMDDSDATPTVLAGRSPPVLRAVATRTRVLHLRAGYELTGRTLGMGAYATVVEAAWRGGAPSVHGGLPVAVKVVDVTIEYSEALRSLREVKVLKFLSECPTSTQLLDGWMHGRQMYLVMPAYEFTLHEVLADASFMLQESHLRRIALLLLRSVAYLHAGGVLHRDIKPYNVLMRADCSLALCDFNLARPARRTASGERMTPLTPFAALPHMSNSVVTRWYRAPEVLLGEPYSYSVDMWAVAATLAEVAMRRPLWPSRNDTHQLQMYVRTLGPPTEADMLEWEAPTRSVMSALAPCAEVIALPTAFPGLHDLLRRILVWQPSARLTAAEALAHPWLSGAVSPAPLPRAPMEDAYEAELAAQGRPADVFRAIHAELASF